MSTFLLYVDLRPPACAPAPPKGLVLIPVWVRPRGISSRPRRGFFITSGHSSEQFQATRMGAIGAQGSYLRELLRRFLTERLSNSGTGGLVFLFISGTVNEEVVTNFNDAPLRSVDEYVAELPKLDSGEVRIVEAGSGWDR